MEHHPVAQPLASQGFTILEVLIGLGIFSLVIGFVYSGYASVIDIITQSQASSAAVSVIESRVEMVRNMRYADVGVVGGIPSGILPQTEEVPLGNQTFTVVTTVRNIDNPFDGTVAGNPLDLNPADYKLVQFDMSCVGCAQSGTQSMVTYIAPKTLEDESKNGSLEISVVDASGQPVPLATVRIVNPAASVNLTTTADNTGKLLLLSVATGSAAYEITASKNGYSTDKTYAPGSPANPLKPNVTVASQQLTLQTMVIDRVSSLTIQAHDRFCVATGPFSFTLTGDKLIGIQPDTPKYSSALALSGGGALNVTQLEWDGYRVTPTDTSLSIVGGTLSFTLDPATTKNYEWVTVPSSQSAILVTVTDETGSTINGADVTLSGGGYTRIHYSGFWSLTDTDWSGGQFTDASTHVDTTSAGVLALKLEGGSYATGSAETLTSRTFNLGTAITTFRTISWNPSNQEGGTSLRFQIAANTDNSTWNYVGPDGTAASYFDTPGQLTPTALNGKQFLRYRAFLETTDESATPRVDDVAILFSSSCLQDGFAHFNGLTANASYTLTVNASGYQSTTQTTTAPANWAQVTVPLTPQ